MRFLTSGNRHSAQRTPGVSRAFKKAGWTFGRTGFLVVAASVVLTVPLTPQAPEQQSPLPEVHQSPDVMKMHEQQNKVKSFEAANVERKRQISDDSAMLLKLATELKTAVDKTSKDTLSIGIIRKADEIERLAHGVKEKMKVTVGAN